jgi:flavodoxin
MKKAMVVFESKYGNTKFVAEEIARGMKKVPGIEVILSEVERADVNQLAAFDAVLVGGPNHMGKPVSNIKKFIEGLGRAKLEGKLVAVFDTYMGASFEKATKKMEEQMVQEAPGMKLISPSLSIRVEGTKGPIADSDIPKAEEFGMRIATLVMQ